MVATKPSPVFAGLSQSEGKNEGRKHGTEFFYILEQISWILKHPIVIMNKLISLFAFLLVGCTTSSETMTELSMGMTKSEVFKLMGKPDSISATNGTEYLTYTLRTETSFTRNTFGYQGQYFVRLVNGRVDSYGKVGDFDTTKDPTLNINVRNR